MDFSNLNIGIGVTGSFCTLTDILDVMEQIKNLGGNITPILSKCVTVTDTRFIEARKFMDKVEHISTNKILSTIPSVEPVGPNNLLDILIIAPCTGNTLAKLANGITDTSVTMVCKGHLRNNKPLVISIATNDGLGLNLKNIGTLYNNKNVYFVPFTQDNFVNKPNSLVADASLICKTIEMALKGEQLQPLLVKDS